MQHGVTTSTHADSRLLSWRPALYYAALAVLYIVVSSHIVGLLALKPEHQAIVETSKGMLFVIITALLAQRLLFARAAQLAVTQRALQERLASQSAEGLSSAAVGATAHEMKNLLMVALTAEQLLRDSGPGLENDERDAVRLDLRYSLKRLNQLAQELLLVARHGPAISDEVFDLSELARGSARLLCPPKAGSAPAIEVEGDAICPVHGSARQLEHAILNLLSNAVQATGAGGRVRLSIKREGSLVVLRVSDDGPGVAPLVRARLFQPFVTTKGARGTGLGLVLTRHIARLFGGDLRLASSSSTGSVFELTLPLAETASEPCSQRPAA